MGTVRKRNPMGRVLLGLIAPPIVVIIVLGFAAVLLIPIPEDNVPPSFTFDSTFGIEKIAAGGTEYAVNNSTATFRLDVADEDRHCHKLFSSYAAALAYCQEAGLPTCPSVHLLQGKCKQFDDGLTATLELAVQHHQADDSGLSKRAALKRLLSALLTLSDELPATERAAADEAVVHVATALKLGGAEPRVPERLAGQVAQAEAAFRDSPGATPIGFWTWRDELRAIFLQDRFLCQGMPADSSQAAVLALAISGDPALAEAFRRFRAFDAKLTNRPVYIDSSQTAALPAPCVSFDDLAGLGASELQIADRLARVRSLASKRFGANAGFALVAYAASKEYTLLASLAAEDRQADTMGLIIDAIKTGRLQLEPTEDSGWYDYQWYALETLLLPDKAQEAGKMELSASYRKRLEDAFRTSLAKHRETHIKRLPFITLCASLGDGTEDPEKIEVGPDFSAEPTATVYLRYARAYRFLRNAVHATVGRDFLENLRRANEDEPPVSSDLDTELAQMALLCYGLYDRLCLEIGQHAEFLPDEMGDADLAAAKSTVDCWLAGLVEDPDLARDTRVAVPIATWPSGPTQYWATGGVRLQRVVYQYDEEPIMKGNVEVTFVPTYYYLPTDISLEFERSSGQPLTRSEYRALCDRCNDEATLRSALGARSRPSHPWWAILMGSVAAVATTVVLLRKHHEWVSKLKTYLSTPWARRLRRGMLFTAVTCLALWLVAIVCLRGYRTKMVVRYVARIDLVAVLLDSRFSEDHSRETIAALVDLHRDSNPQTRYLASRYLQFAWPPSEMYRPVLQGIPDLKTRLQAAAVDAIPDVAGNSIRLLGDFRDPQNVDFLLQRLQQECRIDSLCLAAITALAEIGDPRALEDVIALTDDPRPFVRGHAVQSLGSYDDERAAARLAELIQRDCCYSRQCGIQGISQARTKFAHPEWEPRFNAALAATARNEGISWNDRYCAAEAITERDLAVEAYCLLLSTALSPDARGGALAGLALARLGRCDGSAYSARWELTNRLEHDEELSRAFEAALGANDWEMLRQLAEIAIGDELARLDWKE